MSLRYIQGWKVFLIFGGTTLLLTLHYFLSFFNFQKSLDRNPQITSCEPTQVLGTASSLDFRWSQRIVVVSGSVSKAIADGENDSVDRLAFTQLSGPDTLYSMSWECQGDLLDFQYKLRMIDSSPGVGVGFAIAKSACVNQKMSYREQWSKPFTVQAAMDSGDVVVWADLDTVPSYLGEPSLVSSIEQLFPASPPEVPSPGKMACPWTGNTEIHIAVLRNDNLETWHYSNNFFTLRSSRASRWTRLMMRLWRECRCDDEATISPWAEQACMRWAVLQVVVVYVLENMAENLPEPFVRYKHLLHRCSKAQADPSLRELMILQGGCEPVQKVGQRRKGEKEGEGENEKGQTVGEDGEKVEEKIPGEDFLEAKERFWAEAPSTAEIIKPVYDALCNSEGCVTELDGGERKPNDSEWGDKIWGFDHLRKLSAWMFVHGFGQAGVAGPVHFGASPAAPFGVLRWGSMGEPPSVYAASIYPSKNPAVWGKPVTSGEEDKDPLGSLVAKRLEEIEAQMTPEEKTWLTTRETAIVNSDVPGFGSCVYAIDFVEEPAELLRHLLCHPKGRLSRWLHRIQARRHPHVAFEAKRKFDEWWETLPKAYEAVLLDVEPSLFCSATFRLDLSFRELSRVFPVTARRLGEGGAFVWSSVQSKLQQMVPWPPFGVLRADVRAAIAWILLLDRSTSEEVGDVPHAATLQMQDMLGRLKRCKHEWLQLLSGIDISTAASAIREEEKQSREMGETELEIESRMRALVPGPTHTVPWCARDSAGLSHSFDTSLSPSDFQYGMGMKTFFSGPAVGLVCHRTAMSIFHMGRHTGPRPTEMLQGVLQSCRWKCPDEWLLARTIGHECAGVGGLWKGDPLLFDAWRDPRTDACRAALARTMH
uniref:Uncharacterized protein n=1 Tax=Chromera velia CCMP2878 TaxID=1169474 RepID=A0A0G4HDP7_9ALVE|eukprot:Cvel_26547.t1-p1 / transcript=Cvel_26547.t1 / gene=Cvel_26547 / organism=Chromera_velia_CCMP2878 / gene_product=hypothetical protein / transcript_product=hypothetical protein / location=Cvel_scaffold3176:6463-11231(+) / protein_length=877 / sequence_SO=supercontig / SO=protein_coding / is_pseudo=false